MSNINPFIMSLEGWQSASRNVSQQVSSSKTPHMLSLEGWKSNERLVAPNDDPYIMNRVGFDFSRMLRGVHY